MAPRSDIARRVETLQGEMGRSSSRAYDILKVSNKLTLKPNFKVPRTRVNPTELRVAPYLTLKASRPRSRRQFSV